MCYWNSVLYNYTKERQKCDFNYCFSVLISIFESWNAVTKTAITIAQKRSWIFSLSIEPRKYNTENESIHQTAWNHSLITIYSLRMSLYPSSLWRTLSLITFWGREKSSATAVIRAENRTKYSILSKSTNQPRARA